MIQEKKDGNSDYFDLRRRMQHSKSMKFINFKSNLDEDSMHLCAPSQRQVNMMIMLREGIDNDLSKFCQIQAEEKDIKPVDLK